MRGAGGPVFSVILATHDRPAELRAALTSLRRQSFSDFQIVLVTDEGGRATRDVAADLLGEADIFLARPGARGPAESRNAGMALASGRWFAFLDDDDLWLPDHLGRMARALGPPDRILHSDYALWHGWNHDLDPAQPGGLRPVSTRRATPEADIGVRNFLPPHCYAVHSTAVAGLGFDPRLETHEDWEFLLHLVKGRGLRLAHLPGSGPVLCLPDRPSRNRGPNWRQTHALDHLAIYRRWRAETPDIAARRAGVLAKLGLPVPEGYL